MLAHGAYAPLDRFVCEHEGRRIRDRGQLLNGAAFPVAVTLVLPSSQVGPDPVDETLVLIDAEGMPVADVSVDSTWAAGRGHVAVSGRVRARAGAGQDVPGLAHSPAHVRALMCGRGALGVLVDRPLLASEVRVLAGIGLTSPVLLLVRSVDPGVPVDVLVEATQSVAKQIPQSLVSTVPFARRDDPEDDEELGEIVIRNFGARPAGLTPMNSRWLSVVSALDEADDAALASLLDPSTEDTLRRWRRLRPSSELTASHGRTS